MPGSCRWRGCRSGIDVPIGACQWALLRVQPVVFFPRTRYVVTEVTQLIPWHFPEPPGAVGGVQRAYHKEGVVVRRLIAFMLVLVMGVAWAGPRDNSLIIGASQEPTAVGDVLAILGSQAIAAEHNVWLFSGLYRIDVDSVLQAELVTEVATVENGRLELSTNAEGENVAVMNLTLRDGLRWSDGTPITTADVALVAEIVKTSGVPLAGISFWQRFTYETIDDLNFRVRLEPVNSSDLMGNFLTPLPAHVLSAPWAAAKAAAAADTTRAAEIYRGFVSDFGGAAAVNAGRTIASGAFKPVRWVPGASMVFERNPNYFEHPENQNAYLRTVEYRYITDTTSLTFQLRTGAVDTASSVSLTFDQAIGPQLTARAPGRYDIWFVGGSVWEHLEINSWSNVQQVADNQLDDVRTRRAIAYAIDRQGMTDALYEGLQPVSHSNVAPAHPTYTDDVRKYDYDPEMARSLLAELGWQPGSDGILQRSVGGRTVRFELEFATTAGNVARERQQQFIAEDLRQVGIDVRINNAPSNVVFADTFINRAYDGAWTGMFMFAWVSSIANSYDQATYICRFAPSPDNNYTGQNAGGACSPRYDELRDQAVAELDLAKSLPLYHEMQRVFAEELLAIPLIFRSTPYVVPLTLQNYVTSAFNNGNGYPPTRPALVGWSENGATKRFDFANYAQKF
jgi:peptide/nickel transport system substrate-binding protein